MRNDSDYSGASSQADLPAWIAKEDKRARADAAEGAASGWGYVMRACICLIPPFIAFILGKIF